MNNTLNNNRDEDEPTRSRRMLPWLLILVVVVIGGAFIWASNRTGKDSSPVAASQSSNAQQSPASQDETEQALATLQQAVNDLKSARQHDADQIADLQRQLSSEEGERKLLSDQVNALSGRVDGLEKARAEVRPPTNRHRRR